MLTRAQKQEQVAELRDKLARASCVYLAEYRGVDVQSVNQLRRRIRLFLRDDAAALDVGRDRALDIHGCVRSRDFLRGAFLGIEIDRK